MITIPDNMNLVTYTEFCSKACNSTTNMQQYICNLDNFVGAIDGPNKIYGPGSKIPEIYLIDQGESVIVKSCDDSKPLNLHKLSELINKQVTKLNNTTINLHLLVCLDVFDISNMENKDNIENNLNYNILSKMKMLDCNEDALKITHQNPFPTNIELKPNTIIGVIDISGTKNKLDLKFKDNVKSDDPYLVYLNIIRQLNLLFKTHSNESNIKFMTWLNRNYNINHLNLGTLINFDLKSNSIIELISKIGIAIVLESDDQDLYNTILSEIPNAINNDNNILIDMSRINISDKENAKIIKKYLFKILNNKINSITEDRAINESIRRAEQEQQKAEEKLQSLRLTRIYTPYKKQ